MAETNDSLLDQLPSTYKNAHHSKYFGFQGDSFIDGELTVSNSLFQSAGMMLEKIATNNGEEELNTLKMYEAAEIMLGNLSSYHEGVKNADFFQSEDMMLDELILEEKEEEQILAAKLLETQGITLETLACHQEEVERIESGAKAELKEINLKKLVRNNTVKQTKTSFIETSKISSEKQVSANKKEENEITAKPSKGKLRENTFIKEKENETKIVETELEKLTIDATDTQRESVSNTEEQEQQQTEYTDITEPNPNPEADQISQQNIATPEQWLEELRLNGAEIKEYNIQDILTMFQSRQNILQEKLLALKATAESLKDQLKSEKIKWKEEIKETVQLEKDFKKKLDGLQTPWGFSENFCPRRMDIFNDYRYITSTTSLEKEIKKRNYQDWLTEISFECELELSKLQNNLTILRPLKAMISHWDIKNDEIPEDRDENDQNKTEKSQITEEEVQNTESDKEANIEDPKESSTLETIVENLI